VSEFWCTFFPSGTIRRLSAIRCTQVRRCILDRWHAGLCWVQVGLLQQTSDRGGQGSLRSYFLTNWMGGNQSEQLYLLVMVSGIAQAQPFLVLSKIILNIEGGIALLRLCRLHDGVWFHPVAHGRWRDDRQWGQKRAGLFQNMRHRRGGSHSKGSSNLSADSCYR
jgi:hypothetical protein